jgi:hypothetical protein
VFNDISADQAVLVLFPGLEEQFGLAYQAMIEGGLKVSQIVWDKGYCGGTVGGRLNYSTENILIGYTTPDVRLVPDCPSLLQRCNLSQPVMPHLRLQQGSR